MKALTLHQPWATLVAIGAKRIDTRSWSTSYRGPLAIHAAQKFPKEAQEFTLQPVCYETVRIFCARQALNERLNGFPAYPVGAILATCRLVNCIPTEVVDNGGNVFGVSLEPLSEQERAFGNYAPGRWAWILEDVNILDAPIRAKGARRIWDWNSTATSTEPTR